MLSYRYPEPGPQQTCSGPRQRYGILYAMRVPVVLQVPTREQHWFSRLTAAAGGERKGLPARVHMEACSPGAWARVPNVGLRSIGH